MGGVDGDVVGGIRGRGCRDGEAGWKGDTGWFQAATLLVYGGRRKEDQGGEYRRKFNINLFLILLSLLLLVINGNNINNNINKINI